MQAIIISAMLIAGCGNSLLTKFQDQQCVSNCTGPVADQKFFDQPVFQTLQMFVAEMGVILVVWFSRWQAKRSRRGDYQEIGGEEEEGDMDGTNGTSLPGKAPQKMDGWKVVLLALPASCDIIGTTLMNVGLLMVPVSIYQMIRGSIVLFVGSFSILFLGRKLTSKQWTGLMLVTAGVFIVGLSAVNPGSQGGAGANSSKDFSFEAMVGILLIMLAQLFTASQFVLEEHLLEKYTMDPIMVVAWEGTFGTSITTVVSLFIYAFLAPNRETSMFNLWQGISEVATITPLLISSIVIMFMLATFNVAGLAVTRIISATSRSTIDTSRTVGIWLVSLLIGWETFKFLQLVGFAVLVYGTLLFNGIVHADVETKKRAEQLLPNEFEHT